MLLLGIAVVIDITLGSRLSLRAEMDGILLGSRRCWCRGSCFSLSGLNFGSCGSWLDIADHCFLISFEGVIVDGLEEVEPLPVQISSTQHKQVEGLRVFCGHALS